MARVFLSQSRSVVDAKQVTFRHSNEYRSNNRVPFILVENIARGFDRIFLQNS